MQIENANILVVDDDDVMLGYVATLLKRLGAEHLQVARDGRSGLEMACSFRPDLIIADVHMEPVDGIDFIRGIRSHPIQELRTIPVLMLSADSSSQTLHESMALGIVGYVVKPPQLSHLKKKIEQALKAFS
jgi:CheY-like chemotaxis protein